ncbi:MAG: CpaF family protein [Legionellales bacterium]|nr:CpaF family protein [Legionellales bacterium]
MLGKKNRNSQSEKSKIDNNTIEDNSTNKSYSNINIEAEKRVEESSLIVHPLIMEIIDINKASEMSQDELIEILRPITSKILNEQNIQLNAKEQSYLEKRLADDMLGLGPLEYFLSDDSISDILVNNTSSIFIERNGILEKSHIKFRTNEQLLNVISRIISVIGRRVDETTPYVDARLHDGSRVYAIIPPLGIDGPCISIRKFKSKYMSLDNLVENNTLSSQMANFLKIAIKCRRNIIVFGGTGSGKTTLLNALSQYIPDTERIITIEDAAELQLQKNHLVRLETRAPNIADEGEITERHLVKNALRMRPDRIILGEIRGEEAFELLQAMNTGHDGSLSTIHASSTKEVSSRLVNMILMAGFKLPAESILGQLANSVHILIEISRMPDGNRKIVNIAEIIGHESLDINTQTLFTYNNHADSKLNFSYTKIKPRMLKIARFYNLEKDLLRLL